MRIEKKLAPEMKVITSVRARVRGACLRRLGNMGNFANLTSQTTNMTRNANPMISGARTWADDHSYWSMSVLPMRKDSNRGKYLVSSPLQTASKKQHAHDTEKASDEVNL